MANASLNPAQDAEEISVRFSENKDTRITQIGRATDFDSLTYQFFLFFLPFFPFFFPFSMYEMEDRRASSEYESTL